MPILLDSPIPTLFSGTTISGNIASGDDPTNGGGGIFNAGGTLDIIGSAISNNSSARSGGGILSVSGGTVVLLDTTVSGNSASPSTGHGGGILNFGELDVTRSTIHSNFAAFNGGISNGLALEGTPSGGNLVLQNTTVSSNTAGAGAGGVLINGGTATISNSTIADNQVGVTAAAGGLVRLDGDVTLVSTLIAGNLQGGIASPTMTVLDVAGDVSGGGNSQFNLIGRENPSDPSGLTDGQDGNQVGTATDPIDARLAPLADNGGPTLTHALLPGSPAINAGDNPDMLDFDQRGMPFVREFGSGVDPQQTDVGAFELQSVDGEVDILVTSTDAGVEGVVTAVNALTGELLFEVTPYAGFEGGVRVAVGDVNGDMTPDVITSPRAGGGPHVKVFDGATGQQLSTAVGEIFPFDQGFIGGVFVASGDLDGDGFADIITAAGPGGGPHVRVFSGQDGGELFNFFAYDFAFAGGVRVAAGDITGDGTPDIITGAGPGAGPHVRVFDGSVPQVGGNVGENAPGPISNFFAYDVGFAGGVFVAAGDVDGNGRIDLITGAGAGGGPHVKVFDAVTGDTLPGDIGDFFAFDASFTGGVRVAASDITGDGLADVIVGAGPTAGPVVRAFSGATGEQVFETTVGDDPSFPCGVFVAATTDLESIGSPLRLGGGALTNADAPSLTASDLVPVFDAAFARLEAAGLSADVVGTLSLTTVEIADLEGDLLGVALPGLIRLDVNAAGAGWFIDPTPNADEEFAGDSLAATGAEATGGVDLLTAVLHELAHQLGGGHLDALMHPGHLLAETLPAGQRRLPDQDDLDALFASGDALDDLLG